MLAEQKVAIDGRFAAALFKKIDNAEAAFQELEGRGFADDRISVLMRPETEKLLKEGRRTRRLKSSAVGGAVGGSIGAVAGALSAVGSAITIPGLGIIVAGPIAGAVAGGTAGGLIGALAGGGISGAAAEECAEGLKQGAILIGVQPESTEEAVEILSSLEKNNGNIVYR